MHSSYKFSLIKVCRFGFWNTMFLLLIYTLVSPQTERQMIPWSNLNRSSQLALGLKLKSPSLVEKSSAFAKEKADRIIICQLIGLFLARFPLNHLNSTGHKHCSGSRSDAGFCSDLSQTYVLLFFIFIILYLQFCIQRVRQYFQFCCLFRKFLFFHAS